jgi:hypothetical protein
MNTLEKCEPSFYGKNAPEKLNTWNTLMSANDFTTLLSDHKAALTTYIACLRKAEIFEQCVDAIAALKQLKEYINWEEDYSVDYAVYTSLTYYCEDAKDFIAHSSKKLNVNSEWVVSEFYQWDGGNCLDWEVRDQWSEKYPGEVHVTYLALIDAEKKQETTFPSVTLG